MAGFSQKSLIKEFFLQKIGLTALKQKDYQPFHSITKD